MIGLDQTANIYAESATTGLYTTLVKTGLACRLIHLNLRLAGSSNDRAELAGQRDMLFDPEYQMPEQCQVEVDGVRWQPKPGTFEALRNWTSDVSYRKCQVERQQTVSFT